MEGFPNGAYLLDRLQRLDVDAVDTGLEVRIAAPQHLFHAAAHRPSRIGSRLDDHIWIQRIAGVAGGAKLADVLKTHLSRLGAGDYFAVLGYITMNPANEKTLQTIRHAVRDKKKVATVLGFGPRFLHSTGQAYKGGPNTGVFLQITCDDAKDLPVPGQKYTFGVVKAAQARGDFAVLAERGRRAVRVHLGKNLKSGLATLTKAVQKAIA